MQQNRCMNCGHNFAGKFCNACGEKVYHEHDKSLTHFFEEGLHFMTHFEGKFLTTLKTIISSPGKVSLDYCNGIRKKYFKPFSLFLLLVIIYLLFPLTQGLNMRAEYHKGNALYGNFAADKILQVQQATGLTGEAFEETFHYKGEKVSRILLIILIPLSALWFWLLTYKKHPYYFDQLVFSSEVNSVFLFWGFILSQMLINTFRYLFSIHSSRNDESAWVALFIYIPIVLFTMVASHRFYQFNKWKSVLFGLAFLLVHTFIWQFIYKLILFVITIHLIH
jgi:hypothetical protein